jgi:hypothetical protein
VGERGLPAVTPVMPEHDELVVVDHERAFRFAP